MFVRLLWVPIIVPTLYCGLSHMAIPNCEGDWEMYQAVCQERK